MIASCTKTDSWLSFRWRRRLVVVLIFLAIVSFNVLNILLTVRLTFCHNRQLQAINTISINVSAAHYKFSKFFSGDRSITPRDVEDLLQQAHTAAEVVLGVSREGSLHNLVLPVEFSGQIETLTQQLGALVRSSRDNLESLSTAGRASTLIAETNRGFRQANETIGVANTLLWQIIRREQSFFVKVQIVITIMSVLLALLTIRVLYRYDRIRDRTLEEKAKQRSQEQFLVQFSRFCRDATAIEPVFEFVTSWLSGHLGIDRVSVWRFESDGVTLSCRSLYDSETRQFLSAGTKLSCEEIPQYCVALKGDQPIVVEDAWGHPATAELIEDYLRPHDIRAMLDIPLKLNGEIVGVLCLEVRKKTRGWEPQEIALCLGVADQVSLAMGRTREWELREKEQAAYAARLEQEVKERTTALATANEALRKKETRLQLIFDKAPFGAALVDLYGHFLQVNEEFTRFIGYSIKELAAVNFLSLVQAENRAHFEENFSSLLASSISKFKADSLYQHRDGGAVWGRTTVRGLRDDSGTPIYFLVLVENISEQKSFEDQLDKLHKAIEQSPLSILVTDASGKIEYANPFFSAVTGYELAEVVGQNPKVLKSNVHEPAFYQNLWQTISAGKTWQGEICNLKKDGTPYWEHALIAPVTDKDGKIFSYIAVKEDISARKQLVDELRERTEIIASIAATALSAIIMIDNHGLVTFWNKAAEKIFGWTREEILGQDLHRSIVNEEYWQRFRAKFGQFQQSGTGQAIGRQVEMNAIRKNGEEFPVELSLSAVRIQGKWHAVGIVNDISERKEAQEAILIARDEAEAANQAKSDFLARMSHEVRTPMNAIIGLSELALEMELAPKLVDYLSKISSSGKTLLCIINEILDFSKIEAKKMAIEAHPFSLEKILTDLAGVTSLKAEEKGLEFMFSVAPEVPDLLVGDSLRLGQILINLVANAIKFTEKGEVILDISVYERGAESLTLHFSVQDTGMGLTEEQLGTLFTPFSQADGSISRNYGGTGLGLAISKRLVELMHGEFEVQSRPGQGSSFSFTAVLAEQPARAVSFPASNDLQGLRVLVVEEHPSTQKILRKALESFSLQVSVVENGEKGLDEFRRAAKQGAPFSLVLLDYRMPGKNGELVTQAVRALPLEGVPPKILVLSSTGGAHAVESCLAAGCDAVVDKPLSRVGLLMAIIRLYEQRNGVEDGVVLSEEQIILNRIDGARVLVVEDNPINQQVVREILRRAGVLVGIANDGYEALAELHENEYDLVLMDIMMPGMDGLQATRAVRASGIQRLVDLPIIAMTGFATREDEELSLAAGMNDHIVKPIVPKVLLATIAQWLPLESHLSIFGQPQEVSADSVGGILPNITGIDQELAMKRLGSTTLHAKLLHSFAEQYPEEADRIIAKIERRSWDDAARALHSLKGVVGAICAQALYDLTVELEQACKKQQAPVALMAAFKACHDQLIVDLHAGLVPPASSFSLSSVRQPSQKMESRLLVELFLSLLPAIKAHRPIKCAAQIAKLKELTWSADRQIEVDQLIAAVENYQFKEAGQRVEQLVAHLTNEGNK